MAIWQFSCSLLPRAALLSRFGELPAELLDEVVEDVPWWVIQQPPLGYESVIESFAPPAKSWSESIRIWVREGGDGPLMRAALSGTRLPMVELLVPHGADVNALWNGSYPIICAPCETLAPRALTSTSHRAPSRGPAVIPDRN
jgi:hypothetical protein